MRSGGSHFTSYVLSDLHIAQEGQRNMTPGVIDALAYAAFSLSPQPWIIGPVALAIFLIEGRIRGRLRK